MSRRLIIELAVVALGAIGCASSSSTSAGAAGTSVHSWCKAIRRDLPPSAEDYCEDFVAVGDGTLPAGWIGADGLLVKPVAVGRGLVPFEYRKQYKVVLPNVVPTGDFFAQAQFVVDAPAAMTFDKNRYTITAGGHEASIVVADDVGNCVQTIVLDRRATSKPERCTSDRRSVLIALSRTGDVVRVHIDGVETVIARLPQSTPSAVAVTFSIARASKAAFELRGVRAVWYPGTPTARRAQEALELLKKSHFDEALKLSSQTLQEARESSDLETRTRAYQAHGFVLVAMGRLDEAAAIAAEADRVKLPAFVSRGILSAVARGRCDFVQAAQLQLVQQDDKQVASKKPALLNLAGLDFNDGRYERALARLDNARAQPNSGTPLEPAWDESIRRTRAATLIRLGRIADGRAEVSTDEFKALLEDSERYFRWSLANKANLYFAVQNAIGVIIGLRAYKLDSEIPAWRTVLAETLAAYATDTSPCHARFPDPIANEPAAVRLVLLGDQGGSDVSRVTAPPDGDGDGIADASDRCPAAAETINGIDDTDGCPDESPGKLVGREIQLREALPFETNSAKIDAGGAAALDWLAKFVNSRPRLAVTIEGHTDDVGDDAFNLDLSKRRAKAVVDALVARGVDISRLAHAGYGETLPKIPGRDAAARAANRRVEILVQTK